MAPTSAISLSGHNVDIVVIALLLGIVIYLSAPFRKSSLSQLPGPWYTKWTSWVLKYYWVRGHRAYYVHELHKKYGPLVRLAPDEVDVSDIAGVKEIHSFKNGYLKSPWYTVLSTSSNLNIFTTIDVEFHRRHRRLLSGPLSESSLKSAAPLVLERAQLAIERIREEMDSRGAADIYKWWLFMATDVIGELSFGESFRMLDIGKKTEYSMFLETIAQVGGIKTTFPGLLKILALFPIPIFKRAAEAGGKITSYAEQSIQRYKRHRTADPDSQKPMLFKKLFMAGEEGLSDDEIRGEAQGYIIAGSDTTANTLTWLVWSVCKHPEIRDTLAKEVLGLSDSDMEPNRLAKLRYLNLIIDETLRLYGAAPSGLPRIVPQRGTQMAGHRIPGGVTVTTQAYSLHRDPDIFPLPDVFDPSRWEEPTKQMKDAFMPFGGGSRICIGLHLARMELRYAAALFFRAFPNAKVSELEGMSDKDMNPRIFFLAVPQGKRCLIQAK